MPSLSLPLDSLTQILPSITLTTLIFSLLLVALFYHLTTKTDIPKIKGIPEIPGALPIVGHLLHLGDDHATVCEVHPFPFPFPSLPPLTSSLLQKWSQTYSLPTFQIRLGNTRAVVVNSFADCKRMLLGNQNAVIDRPKLFTFHGVISSTQGFTIGSSPWDESCKNKRKAAGQTLGRVAMRGYVPMFVSVGRSDEWWR